MKRTTSKKIPLLIKILFFPFWILYLLFFRKPDPHLLGERYERKICQKLRRRRFTNVMLTPKSGDHGIDIIAFKHGKSYAIQCKYYTIPVSNRAVQEAYSGCSFYGCDIPVVVTNHTFTRPAIREAEQNGVLLWPESRIPRTSPVTSGTHLAYCLWCGLLISLSVFFFLLSAYLYWHAGQIESAQNTLFFAFPCLVLLLFSRTIRKSLLHRKLKNLTPP